MSLQAKRHNTGMVELWDLFQDGGPVVRCYPDGRIELFEIPLYGGEEREYGNYPTICAALDEAKNWT